MRGTVSATIRTAIKGGDIGDAVLSSLQSVGVNTVLSSVQSSIGDLTDGVGANDLPLANILAHSVAGGLAAEALGESFASGATAAFASAVAANSGLFDDLFAGDSPQERAQKIGQIGQLIGSTASFLVSSGRSAGAVNQGASIAQSATLNNYLTHSETAKRARAKNQLKKCQEKVTVCTAETISLLKAEISKLDTLDFERDKALIEVCASGNRMECTLRRQRVWNVLKTFHFEAKEYFDSPDAYLAEYSDIYDQLNAEYESTQRIRKVAHFIVSNRSAKELKLMLNGYGLGAVGGASTALILASGSAGVVATQNLVATCGKVAACYGHFATILIAEIAAAPEFGGSGIAVGAGILASQYGDDLARLFSSNNFWKPLNSDNAYEFIDKFRYYKGGLDELGDLVPIKGDGQGTVAVLQLPNGRPVFGVNSSTLIRESDKNLGRLWKEKLGLTKGVDQVIWHAEGHSLMRAYEKTGGKLPQNMTLFVDRVSCPNCRTHLPKLTEEMGIKNLTLNFKDGRSGKISNGRFDWND